VADEDYSNDRSVPALVEYAVDMVARGGGGGGGKAGCQLSGSIVVNRLRGNFHIKAGSDAHGADPAAANLRCGAAASSSPFLPRFFRVIMQPRSSFWWF